MKKRRKASIILAATVLSLVLVLSLTGCVSFDTQSAQSESSAKSQPTKTSAQASPLTANVKEEDLKCEWDTSATTITLNGTTMDVMGAGAKAVGSVLVISNAGTYVVSGTLTDGQILIDASKEDLVHLVLNGVTITNQTGAPFYAPQCDKLVITLAGGTENTLTDGASSFTYADTAEEEPNAALFCKNDLTLNGNGTLTVSAGFHNGIATKDDLLILGGRIAVTAANHALRGNDSVAVLDGTLSLAADNDGIQTNNTEDADKGWILLEGGTLAIVAGHDGMQADSHLVISGGTVNIIAGNGSQSDSDSCKGLKSAGDLSILDGDITIKSEDDCVHANGDMDLSGGTLTLHSGDDGVHADGDLRVRGSEITVTQSYEGLEATNIIIEAGNISIISSDDGINAAGGMDESGWSSPFRRDQFGGSDQYSITLAGGSVYVLAGGDGLDSNGSIVVTGGELICLIQSSKDNDAMDCDGTYTVTGGTLIYGGTGAGGTPNDQSYAYLSTSIEAETEISLQKDGRVLVSFTPPISCASLIVSTSDMVNGESYDFVRDGQTLATVTAGAGGGQMMHGMPGGGRRGW